MLDPTTATTVLIELYLFGILSHFLLVSAVFRHALRDSTRPATRRWSVALTTAMALLWPGVGVLILISMTPLGARFAAWLDRKADQIDPNTTAA